MASPVVDPLRGLRYFTLQKIILEVPNPNHLTLPATKDSEFKLGLSLKHHNRDVNDIREATLSERKLRLQSDSAGGLAGTSQHVVVGDLPDHVGAFQIEDNEDCTLQLDLTPMKENKSNTLEKITDWRKGKGRRDRHQVELKLTATGRELHSDSKVEGEHRRGDGEEDEDRVRVFSKEISVGGHIIAVIVHFKSNAITDDPNRLIKALKSANEDLLKKDGVYDQFVIAEKIFDFTVDIARLFAELAPVAKVVVGGLTKIHERLKSQKDFNESIKERLAEIHGFLAAIEGDVAALSSTLLPNPAIRSSIKELFQHAQDVILYVLKYGKAGGKGQAILDLIRIPDAIAQSKHFKERFDAIQQKFNAAISVETHKATHKLSTKADWEDVRKWLSPLEFSEEGVKYREHTPDTGEWFFNSQEFVDWRDGSSRATDVRSSCDVLWCPGGPGAGKSVMSALTIRHLEDRMKSPVLKIFCNHTRRGEQTIMRLTQSLWWQLTEARRVISDNLRKHHTAKQRSLTDKELWAAMRADFYFGPTDSNAYIVVDGLDELDNEVMREFIISLIGLPSNCHLLLTSRDLPVISQLLATPYTRLEIGAHQQDLKVFINTQCHKPGSQISELISDAGESLFEEIEQTILQKAGSMFLLARLQLYIISQQFTVKGIRKELKQLPAGLEETYNRTLKRLQEEPTGFLAQKILSWVTFAFRPLTVGALQVAMAIDDGDDGFDWDKVPLERALVSSCLGLIAVDPKTDNIYLFHETTHAFLAHHFTEQLIHAEILDTCLTLLSFSITFPNDLHKPGHSSKTWFKMTALLHYAATFWVYHAQVCQLHGHDQKIAKLLLHSTCLELIFNHVDALVWSNQMPSYHKWNGKDWSGMHVAALFNLVGVMEDLIKQWTDCPELEKPLIGQDKYGWTPLHLASQKGHEKVVEVILASPIPMKSLFSQDLYGQTPLHLASQRGRQGVVKTILASPIPMEFLFSLDKDGQTPLHLASRGGQQGVVEVILASSIMESLFSQDKYGRTPLHLASREGHQGIVEAVLASPIPMGYLFSSDKDGQTPLHFASHWGRKEVVEAILASPIPIETLFRKDKYGQTPLNLASWNGHQGVVEAILASSIPMESLFSSDEGGWTPLHSASWNGHQGVVEAILASTVPMESLFSQDQYDQTPLHLASRGGHADVVATLLARQVDPNRTDNQGFTPLHLASLFRHAKIVKLLLDTGKVDPKQANKQGKTALDLAVEWGYMAEVVELLRGWEDISADDRVPESHSPNDES